MAIEKYRQYIYRRVSALIDCLQEHIFSIEIFLTLFCAKKQIVFYYLDMIWTIEGVYHRNLMSTIQSLISREELIRKLIPAKDCWDKSLDVCERYELQYRLRCSCGHQTTGTSVWYLWAILLSLDSSDDIFWWLWCGLWQIKGKCAQQSF